MGQPGRCGSVTSHCMDIDQSQMMPPLLSLRRLSRRCAGPGKLADGCRKGAHRGPPAGPDASLL